LVDFYADWCGPCKNMWRDFIQVADQVLKALPTLKVARIDSDHAPKLSKRFNIDGVPYFQIYANGKMLDSTVGYNNIQGFLGWMINKINPECEDEDAEEEEDGETI